MTSTLLCSSFPIFKDLKRELALKIKKKCHNGGTQILSLTSFQPIATFPTFTLSYSFEIRNIDMS